MSFAAACRPVHGAKVEISECVDRRLRATTDSNGLAVFAKDNGIEVGDMHTPEHL